MQKPIDAVLVKIETTGDEKWCRARMVDGSNGEPGYVWSYVDVITGTQYPPSQCQIIREGRVIVAATEVK